LELVHEFLHPHQLTQALLHRAAQVVPQSPVDVFLVGLDDRVGRQIDASSLVSCLGLSLSHGGQSRRFAGTVGCSAV
jgi:hypothetical protein